MDLRVNSCGSSGGRRGVGVVGLGVCLVYVVWMSCSIAYRNNLTYPAHSSVLPEKEAGCSSHAKKRAASVS